MMATLTVFMRSRLRQLSAYGVRSTVGVPWVSRCGRRKHQRPASTKYRWPAGSIISNAAGSTAPSSGAAAASAAATTAWFVTVVRHRSSLTAASSDRRADDALRCAAAAARFLLEERARLASDDDPDRLPSGVLVSPAAWGRGSPAPSMGARPSQGNTNGAELCVRPAGGGRPARLGGGDARPQPAVVLEASTARPASSSRSRRLGQPLLRAAKQLLATLARRPEHAFAAASTLGDATPTRPNPCALFPNLPRSVLARPSSAYSTVAGRRSAASKGVVRGGCVSGVASGVAAAPARRGAPPNRRLR